MKTKNVLLLIVLLFITGVFLMATINVFPEIATRLIKP